MADVESIRNWLIKIAPRITKAVIKGFLWFLLLYMVPMLILSMVSAPIDFFQEYTTYIGVFAAIAVFFVVIAELLSKTVFQHACNIAKALVMMVFFVHALNGGFLTVNFETIRISVDLRVYLAMLLAISFLGLAKSALQTLNFLSEKITDDKLPTH